MTPLKLPGRFDTERLTVRRWRPADAPLIKRAIDASLDHLRPWMPWAKYEPSPLADVEARLANFAADFDAGREWIYGIFPHGEGEALGGLGIHPRGDVTGRPECVEFGYWLRADATSRGFVTEAVRAAVGVASALPGVARIEIRCDPRNVRSAAVPARLGFRHVRTLEKDTVTPAGEPRDTMVWEWLIVPNGGAGV